jgi:4-hydroxybenzoate polyprenyltransferase
MKSLLRNLWGLFQTLRPKQQVKNVFVFAALVFDKKLSDWPLLAKTLLAFLIFCLVAGTVYIINDLVDLDKDKLHPKKRRRALPSGHLQPWFAIAGAAVILAAGLPVAYWLDPYFFAIVLGYFLLNLAYTFYLKHLVIIDVMTVASGFVLRVAAGVVVAEAERFSPWLYVCTIFLALFMAIGRRRHELILLSGNAENHRKILNEYTVPFLDQMTIVVVTATLIAYSLYTATATNLPCNHGMLLTIPFVIYGMFRYLHLVQVKGQGGAPEDLLFTDRPFLIAVALWGAAVILVMYVFYSPPCSS